MKTGDELRIEEQYARALAPECNDPDCTECPVRAAHFKAGYDAGHAEGYQRGLDTIREGIEKEAELYQQTRAERPIDTREIHTLNTYTALIDYIRARALAAPGKES